MSEEATAEVAVETDEIDSQLEALSVEAPAVEKKPEGEAKVEKPDAPAKAEPAATVDVPAKTDEPAKTADESQSEHNRVMADLRRKATEHEREVAELRQQLEQVRTAPARTEPAKIAAPDVFVNLARANRGGFADYEGQNERVRAAALSVITDELSSRDIAAVQRAALSGQYGEMSGEIADQASKALPLAQQREYEVAESTRRGEAERVQAYQAELAEATKEFAPYADPETPEGKFLAQWRDVVLPALDKGVQQYIAAHPKLLGQMVQKTHSLFNAAQTAQATEMARLKQENETMRKKLALKDSPERPSAPVTGTETKGADKDLEEIDRQLEELSAKGG